MATYQAFVLQDPDSGQVWNTFLVRAPEGKWVAREDIVAMQQLVYDKYKLALTPVDLEVVEFEQIKERVKARIRGR